MKMDMLRNMNQSAMNTAKTKAQQTVQASQQTAQQAHQQVQPLSEQELLEMRLALLNQQEKMKLQNNQELLKTLQGLKKNFTEIDSDLKKFSNAIQVFHANALQNYQRTVQAPMKETEKLAKETQETLQIIQRECNNISASWNTSVFFTAFVASLSTSVISLFLFKILPQMLGK